MARGERSQRRHARQQKEEEEKDKAEHEQRELEYLEMEVAEGLLMMNEAKSVAVQTDVKDTTDSSQQTEMYSRSVQTQTQATDNPIPPELEPSAMMSTSAISVASLKDNDSKTKFYTGLPTWTLFVRVFNLVSPFIIPSRTRLDLQDELILVLVKLRLNLPFQDLAYRWEVSISTISRLFHKWVDVMSERMVFLIRWPSQDSL